MRGPIFVNSIMHSLRHQLLSIEHHLYSYIWLSCWLPIWQLICQKVILQALARTSIILVVFVACVAHSCGRKAPETSSKQVSLLLEKLDLPDLQAIGWQYPTRGYLLEESLRATHGWSFFRSHQSSGQWSMSVLIFTETI